MVIDQKPIYGLKAYELNKGPIQHFVSKAQALDMLQNHALISRPSFYQAFSKLNELKLEVMDKTPMFQVPLQSEIAELLIR